VKKLLLTLLFSLGLLTSGWATDYTQDVNCVGAWLLDETSGTYADSSGEGNTGTVNGGTMGATGVFGKAYDGSSNQNNYVTFGSGASLDDNTVFSYVGWVKYVGTDRGNQPLFGKDQKSLYLFNYNSALQGKVMTNGTVAESRNSAGVSTTQFDHLAMLYDNAGDRKIDLYMNGVEQSYSLEIAATGTLTSDDSSNFILQQGSYAGTALYGKNLYDEVGCFDDILTSTEINDIMDNGLAGAVAAGDIGTQIISIM